MLNWRIACRVQTACSNRNSSCRILSHILYDYSGGASIYRRKSCQMCLELNTKTTSFILDNFCLFVVLIKWINEFNRLISYLSFVFCILEIQQTHSGICLSPYKKLCYYFECIQYDQFIWFFTLTWIDLELFELRAEIRDRESRDEIPWIWIGHIRQLLFLWKKKTRIFFDTWQFIFTWHFYSRIQQNANASALEFIGLNFFLYELQ